jgi:hypothetical protein
MNPKKKQDLILQEVTEADKVVERICEEADKIESEARNDPDKTKRNYAGDLVATAGRPNDGWGRCRHIDVDSQDENCQRERFSETTPFCMEHIKYWRNIRAQRIAKKLSDDESAHSIPSKYYSVQSSKDAVILLAKVGTMVERGRMTSVKAETIIKIVEAMMRALSHRRDDAKAKAYIRKLLSLKKAEEVDTLFDESFEEGELEAIAERAGLMEGN